MVNWIDTGKETEPDDRQRVTVVPAYEAWFHQKTERVADFKLAVSQAEAGHSVSVDLDEDDLGDDKDDLGQADK